VLDSEDFKPLVKQLKNLSSYIEALEARLLVADPESIAALPIEQVRTDYEMFTRSQINILEFLRKWEVQSKQRPTDVDPSMLALAQELSKLDPKVLDGLQKSMSKLHLVPAAEKKSTG